VAADKSRSGLERRDDVGEARAGDVPPPLVSEPQTRRDGDPGALLIGIRDLELEPVAVLAEVWEPLEDGGSAIGTEHLPAPDGRRFEPLHEARSLGIEAETGLAAVQSEVD